MDALRAGKYDVTPFCPEKDLFMTPIVNWADPGDRIGDSLSLAPL